MAVLTVQVGASNGDADESSPGTTTTTPATVTIGGLEWGGWRFTNVTIPQGAVITSAYLTLEAAASQDPWHDLWAQAADNASAFSAGAFNFNISSRTRTSTGSKVTWNQLLAISAGTRFNSPQIYGMVQEVIDRPGWASGNALVILAKGLSGPRSLRIRNYDNAAGDAAELTITYFVDVDFTGTDGTLAFTGEAGSFDILPSTDLTGTDGTLELAGEAGAFDVLTTLIDFDAIHNLVTNGGFETDTTGWGTEEIMARSNEQAFNGSYSLKCSRDAASGAGEAYCYFAMNTLNAEPHALSAYVYVPANFDGAGLNLSFEGYTGASPSATVTAAVNMSLRDQWQRVEVSLSPVLGDRDGFIAIRGSGAVATAGRSIYVDAVQVERGSVATPYIETDGAIQSWKGGMAFSGELGAYETFRWYEEPTGRLRVDLYSNAGVRLASAPLEAVVADYNEAVGEVGAFSLEMSATLEGAALLQHGIRVMIHREQEGAVFYGIVRERATVIDSNGDPRIVVRGPSSADDLVSANCLLGRPYENQSPHSIATDLLTLVTGWTLGTVGATFNGITSISVEGESVFAALRQLADRANLALRINNVDRVVDLLDLEADDPEMNRVFNGDFELTPLTDSSNGWEDAISASVDIQTETTTVYAGAASAAVTALADGVYRGIIQAGTGSPHDRAFGVSPGHTVTVSFALKAPSIAHTYTAYFSWNDEEGAFISDSLTDFTPTTTEWELHQVTSAAAPVGAVLCRVGILRKTDAAITFYLDNVGATVSHDIEDSGIRLAQLPAFDPEHARDYPDVIPINAMEVLTESFEVWNSLLPIGSGEGDGALTLEHSTRIAPYAINAAIAPNGRSLLYIEDAASVAAYGRRQRVIADKRAVPAEISETALEAASNALYDGSVRALKSSKDPRVTYRVRPGQMAHVADGDFRFKLGQRFRTVFRGMAPRADGTGWVFLDVNEDLFLSRFARRLGDDGADVWDIELTDRIGERLDAAGVLARYLEDVWAMQVQPRLVPDGTPTQPPAPELPEAEDQTMTADLKNYLWVYRANLSFEINQSGGGAWGGTIEINGDDVTTALGGPFTSGTPYTVNVRPYLDRGVVNTIKFTNPGTDFTADATLDLRGVRR